MRRRERDEGRSSSGVTATTTGRCSDTGATYAPGDLVQRDGKGGWKLVWQAPANRGSRT